MERKIHSQSGETIGETLVALLISSLALVMLAGAIATSVRLITNSEREMQTYYAGMNGLGSPNESGLTIQIKDATSATGSVIKFIDDQDSIPVKYYLNKVFSNKYVMSYNYEQ